MKPYVRFAAALSMSLHAGLAHAGDVEVLAAELRQESAGKWHASVTLRHADTGWEHYADAWRVVGGDGAVYGTRTLYHPHETEQPFTRSLGGIAIAPATARVFVEAHDKVHGWSPARLEVDLSSARDGRVRVER
jgi:hypothetical protein